MKRRLALLAVVVGCLCATSVSLVWGAPPSAYTVRVLAPTQGPHAFQAIGPGHGRLGEDGSVAGHSNGTAHIITPQGLRITLGRLDPAQFSFATVVTPTRVFGYGYVKTAIGLGAHAFEWTARYGMRDITGTALIAAPIGALTNGVWVGWARASTLSDFLPIIAYGSTLWYLHPQGGETGLAVDLNAYQVVLGASTTTTPVSNTHATFWWLGQPYDLHPPTEPWSQGIAINNRNQMLIQAGSHTYLWSPDTRWQLIPPPPGVQVDWTGGQSVNDQGTIVGLSADTQGVSRTAIPWRHTSERGTESLQALTVTPGWTITAVLDINNREQILAYGTHGPETYTILLLPQASGPVASRE